jgi:hypothetical protein
MEVPRLSVSRVERDVVIVVRPAKGAGPTAALSLSCRAASALWPLLMAAASDADEQFEAECDVCGELTTGMKQAG